MAARVLTQLMLDSRVMTPLLRRPNPFLIRQQNSGKFSPDTPFLPRKPLLFTVESIKKYCETIPIIAIVLLGLTCELAWAVRLALTRDDVLYCKALGMACDYIEVDKPRKPPIRKFVVYNQKYETPKGLIDALHEPTEEELREREERNKPEELTFWEWLMSFFFARDKKEKVEKIEKNDAPKVVMKAPRHPAQVAFRVKKVQNKPEKMTLWEYILSFFFKRKPKKEPEPINRCRSRKEEKEINNKK